jgi:hypothetical protein
MVTPIGRRRFPKSLPEQGNLGGTTILRERQYRSFSILLILVAFAEAASDDVGVITLVKTGPEPFNQHTLGAIYVLLSFIAGGLPIVRYFRPQIRILTKSGCHCACNFILANCPAGAGQSQAADDSKPRAKPLSPRSSFTNEPDYHSRNESDRQFSVRVQRR